MNTHEESIIKTFIVRRKRDRFLTLLSGKRRKKALDTLNHLDDLDPRYSTELDSSADVVAELRSRGAPATCYLISDTPHLDGREMTLVEAIGEIERGEWGTLVGCIPGKLAYYYGEQGERRVVLERK